MKAILYTKYGPPDVLQLQEIEKPTPKNTEVLVKVHASSVNALEWRRFTLPSIFVRLMGGGLREPKDKSIGGDLAGCVEAVGANVVLGGSMGQIVQGMLLAPLLSRLGNKKMRGVMTKPNRNDLVFLKELLEAGKVVPVIDRRYPLAEVAEAIKYLVDGHARGKVVIAV